MVAGGPLRAAARREENVVCAFLEHAEDAVGPLLQANLRFLILCHNDVSGCQTEIARFRWCCYAGWRRRWCRSRSRRRYGSRRRGSCWYCGRSRSRCRRWHRLHRCLDSCCDCCLDVSRRCRCTRVGAEVGAGVAAGVGVKGMAVGETDSVQAATSNNVRAATPVNRALPFPKEVIQRALCWVGYQLILGKWEHPSRSINSSVSCGSPGPGCPKQLPPCRSAPQ